MSQAQFTLREKVAQLFILGSDAEQSLDDFDPFFATGLGGFIAFRHHAQPYDNAFALRDAITQFKQRFKGSGLSFISLDQEGGQVERLPHWLFPAGVNAINLAHKSPHWVGRMATEQAQRLRWLGFNLNYTPVVDLNTQWLNPIIGVRSFGTSAKDVTERAQAIMQAYLEAGVMPVAKHFPGHGSGTIDSHLDLPIFENWDEAEWQPYENLVKANLPGVLVAHGLYPKLSEWLGADPKIPASLSPDFIQSLLRQKLGFQGLVFTDDLMMGALKTYGDPGEISIKAVQAGADILIWRRAQPEGLVAYEALVHAFEKGQLSENQLDNTLMRIFQARDYLNKKTINEYSEDALLPEGCHQQSRTWAKQSTRIRHELVPSALPLNRFTQWALIYPKREDLIHYADDLRGAGANGRDIPEWASASALTPTQSYAYSPLHPDENEWPCFADTLLDVIVFICFNAARYPHQADYAKKLQLAHPNAKLVLVSAAMPTDAEMIESPWAHIQMPSLRPAAIEALIDVLGTGKSDY